MAQTPPSSRPFAAALASCAPAAVEVEIRDGARRVFRLSRAIGESAVVLQRTVPFEPDQPVNLRFVLPGDTQAMVVRGRIEVLGEEDEQDGTCGGKAIRLDTTTELRGRLSRYAKGRLGEPA